MRTNTVIQQSIACFLLVLFLAGSLHKSQFHELIADHTDMASCEEQHTNVVLHKQSVNCHFDDLVVSKPFIQAASQVFSTHNRHFEREHAVFSTTYFYSFVQHKESRGPPSLNT